MRKSAEFDNIEIHAEPSAGAYIGNCIRDAIIMALMEDVRVVFEYNGRRYTISPEDLHKAVTSLEMFREDA